MESSTTITLISLVDGSKVDIDVRSARLAGLVKNLLEEYKDEKELQIPEVDGNNLKLIGEFLGHYKETDPVEVPKPLPKYDIAETYGQWDEEFISKIKEKEALVQLMEAANYLDCKPLLELAASHVACQIKDYTGKEMLDYFGLEEDMTEEDVKKMEEDFIKEKEAEREAERLKDLELQKEKEMEKTQDI